MPTTTVTDQLRLRIDASKYAEPGQLLSVRISGSAREAHEFERVVLRLMLQESVPGRHGPRQEEQALLERVVVDDDVHLTKGQNVSYTVDLEIPPDAPPTTGSAHHSLIYELRAEVLSGFDQAVGSARRSLTVQSSRARSGGLPPNATDQVTLVRTYKSDLLFGLIPVGSQVNCSLVVEQPTYGNLSGFMLGERVTGQLLVTSKKSYAEGQIWWGATVRGGGKSDKFDLGGPVTVALDQNQNGEFAFNLPDRAPVSYTGRLVDYSWFLRVELVDVAGSNHKEEFALRVLPRVNPRTPPQKRESLTRPKTSSTRPQGLSAGRVGGLTLGAAGGLTSAHRGGLKIDGGLKLSSGKPQGLVLRPPTAHAAPEGLQVSSEMHAPPEGLQQTSGGLHTAPVGLQQVSLHAGPQGVPQVSPHAAPAGLQQVSGGLHLELDDLHVERREHPDESPPSPGARPLEVQPVQSLSRPSGKKAVQPPKSIQTAVAAQLTHEGPGLSPEVVQYLAKIVQSSPFFANLLPDDLATALSSPEALKGKLTPELRQVLQQKLAQNPQIARVLPPHLVGAVAAAKTADQAQDVVGDALTERLLARISEQPRIGVALKYVVSNFPGFKKRLPSAIVDALPEGPGKIDLGALGHLLSEFPELKKYIPAGIQAMLGSKKK